jgi:general secretion pathway protein L
LADKLITRFESGGLHWFCSDKQWLQANADGSFDGAALRALAASNPDGICLAVPGESVVLSRQNVAAAERRYLKDSLPFLFEDSLAGDVESLHFVHRERDGDSISVAVVERAAMDDWLQQCADLGLEVDCCLPEYLVLPWRPASLTLVIEGGRAIVRTGLDAGFCTESSLLPVLLRLYCEESEILPETVLVYGVDRENCMALLPEILRGFVQWELGGFYAAALSDRSERHRLNLLQGVYMPSLPWLEWWRQWRFVAALLLTATLVQVGSSYAELRSLGAENLELRTAMEREYRRVNPSGSAQDPVRKLTSQLAAMQSGPQGSGFVPLLQQVGSVLDAQTGVEFESINFSDRNGDLRLNFMAADYQAVNAARNGLVEVGLDATLQNSSAKGTQVRARLLVKEK